MVTLSELTYLVEKVGDRLLELERRVHSGSDGRQIPEQVQRALVAGAESVQRVESVADSVAVKVESLQAQVAALEQAADGSSRALSAGEKHIRELGNALEQCVNRQEHGEEALGRLRRDVTALQGAGHHGAKQARSEAQAQDQRRDEKLSTLAQRVEQLVGAVRGEAEHTAALDYEVSLLVERCTGFERDLACGAERLASAEVAWGDRIGKMEAALGDARSLHSQLSGVVQRLESRAESEASQLQSVGSSLEGLRAQLTELEEATRQRFDSERTKRADAAASAEEGIFALKEKVRLLELDSTSAGAQLKVVEAALEGCASVVDVQQVSSNLSALQAQLSRAEARLAQLQEGGVGVEQQMQSLRSSVSAAHKELAALGQALHEKASLDQVGLIMDRLSGFERDLSCGAERLSRAETALAERLGRAEAALGDFRGLPSQLSAAVQTLGTKAGTEQLQSVVSNLEALRTELLDLEQAMRQRCDAEHTQRSEAVASAEEGIAALKELVRRMEFDSSSAASQLKALDGALGDCAARTDLHQLSSKLSALQSQVARVDACVQESGVGTEKQVQLLRSALADAQKELATIGQALPEKAPLDQVQRMQAAVASVQERLASVDKLEGDLQEVQHGDLPGLQSKVTRLELSLMNKADSRDVQQLQETVASAPRETPPRVESALASVRRTTAGMEQTLQAKADTKDLQQLSSVVSGLQSRMLSVDRAQQIETNAQHLETTLVTLKRQVTSLEANMAAQGGSDSLGEGAQRHLSQLQQQQQLLQSTVRTLEGKVVDMEQSVQSKATITQMQQMKASIAVVEEKANDVEQAIEEKADMKQVAASLQSLTSQVAGLEQAASGKVCADEFSGIKSSIASMEAHVSAMDLLIADRATNSQFQQLKSTVSKLEASVAFCDRELKAKTEHLSKLGEAAGAAQTQVSPLAERLDQLAEALRGEGGQRSKLEREVVAIAQRYERDLATGAERVIRAEAALGERIARSEAALGDFRGLHSQLSSAVQTSTKACAEQLQSVMGSLEGLRTQIMELEQATRQRCDAERAQREDAAAAAEQSMQALEDKVRRIETEGASAAMQLKVVEAALDDHSAAADLQQLSAGLSALQAQVSRIDTCAQEAGVAVEQQIQTLRSNLSSVHKEIAALGQTLHEKAPLDQVHRLELLLKQKADSRDLQQLQEAMASAPIREAPPLSASRWIGALSAGVRRATTDLEQTLQAKADLKDVQELRGAVAGLQSRAPNVERAQQQLEATVSSLQRQFSSLESALSPGSVDMGDGTTQQLAHLQKVHCSLRILEEKATDVEQAVREKVDMVQVNRKLCIERRRVRALVVPAVARVTKLEQTLSEKYKQLKDTMSELEEAVSTLDQDLQEKAGAGRLQGQQQQQHLQQPQQQVGTAIHSAGALPAKKARAECSPQKRFGSPQEGGVSTPGLSDWPFGGSFGKPHGGLALAPSGGGVSEAASIFRW